VLTTITCQVKVTGPALITVSTPTTTLPPSVSIMPAGMCPAVTLLLTLFLQMAATSLAVLPHSECLLALSRQATPANTATKTRVTHVMTTLLSAARTKSGETDRTRPDDEST